MSGQVENLSYDVPCGPRNSEIDRKASLHETYEQF